MEKFKAMLDNLLSKTVAGIDNIVDLFLDIVVLCILKTGDLVETTFITVYSKVNTLIGVGYAYIGRIKGIFDRAGGGSDSDGNPKS